MSDNDSDVIELRVSARTARWVAMMSAWHAEQELGYTPPEDGPYYAQQLVEIAKTFSAHRQTAIEVTLSLSRDAVGSLGEFYHTYANRTGHHVLFRISSTLLRAAWHPYESRVRLPDDATPPDQSI
ncbi:hypothetical protein SAMN04487819_1145 [Actinopolyspora alba]|uniref:Uncharacterized protein n=1 Tax=Actinopolyspora alba TaxID=673379 RepID=A0A1I2AMN9_9ACTN|nr:hypothetical protein [Actinopolyspora alba]SFE45126.1 hypothetical protein SAMN04487819_1145 [Actinopolyspora alba]